MNESADPLGVARAATIAPQPAAAPVQAAPVPRPAPDPALTPVFDFKWMRRLLWVALVAAIVFPLAYVGVSAYFDFRDRIVVATDMVSRTARAAEEQALKLFDIDAALTSRLADALGTRTDAAIRQNERDFHVLAAQIGGGYPQVAAISIFGTHGAMLASTKLFPVPAISIDDRSDFQEVRDAPKDFSISGPMRSRVADTDVFNIARGRVDADGHFLGLVSVAMNPGYFQSFYRDLVGADSPIHLALIRSDGAVLAWYPPLSAAMTTLAPDTAFMQAVNREVPAGVVRMHSVLNDDDRLFAFRRVGAYNAYVSAGYPMSAIWAAWRKHLLLVGAATCLPSLALCFMLIVSMRRLRAEEQTWGRLIEEAQARALLEKAQRETQRLETLGNLVGAVAHDFNNLLMSISAHVQTGLRHVRPVEQELNAIMRAVRNGQALTRRLLGVARKQTLREERLVLSRQGYDFSLIKATLGDAIALDISLPGDAWPIRVDVAEFEMALLNVALNARDAMPHGGTFALRVENVTLDAGDGGPAFAGGPVTPLPGGLSGEFLKVAMRDSGAGMSAEVRAKAFEPFYSTKAPGLGTGLGLPQCRAFCERSGGAIQLRSEPGQGTEVIFLFPRVVDEPAAQPAFEPQPPEAVGACRILLVEDDVTVAEAEQVLLEMLGHSVTRVADAAQALQALAQDASFDVVLSDVQMPGGISGIDLAERLRQERPDLPVVLVTGYTSDLVRLQATGLAVFTKPFDITALHNHIVAVSRQPAH